MKVIAFSVPPHEKGILAHANQKKHEITLIANALSLETTFYAQGKQAIIDFSCAPISAQVLGQLASLGIKYVLIHSEDSCPPDQAIAAYLGLQWVNVALSPATLNAVSLEEWNRAAVKVIWYLDNWQLEK